MELGQVQEDYLEAIYVLREKSGQVKCVHLADYMERSKPTILTAMKVLEEKGVGCGKCAKECPASVIEIQEVER